MPAAYAQSNARSIANTQYTDGRTDGQDVEPPSLGDLLQLSDACETSGEISARSVGAKLKSAAKRPINE